jgi:hypothetical protein
MNDSERLFLEAGAFRVDPDGSIWRVNGGEVRAEKKGRYRQVAFGPASARRYVYAHRIVYLVHHGDIPDGMQINHKDGDKWNNHPGNLELATPGENSRHAIRVLGVNIGEKHGMSKLSNRDVREIRRLCRQGVTRRRIAERFKIDPGNVTKIAQRKTWQHVQ